MRILIFFLAFFLAFQGFAAEKPKPDTSLRDEEILAAIATAADYASTRLVFSTSGAVERNALLGRHAASQAAIMAGAYVVIIYVARRAAGRGHVKMARRAMRISSYVHFGAAGFNSALYLAHK